MTPPTPPAPRSAKLRALFTPSTDIRLGIRMLARYPGLSLVGTAAIAVGIALGTVYFQALHKWQHPRLPVAHPERFVSIRNWSASSSQADARLLYDFSVWRTQVPALDQMGAAVEFVRNLVTPNGLVQPVRGAEITANAFTMLGARPLMGRMLTAQDEQAGQPLVTVIGKSVWDAQFQSDPTVLGRTVKVGSETAMIVGVMPGDFGFPVNEQLWLPLRMDVAQLAPRSGPVATVFGRLAPNATLADAQSQVSVVSARLAVRDSAAYAHITPRVTPYAQPLGGSEFLIVTRVVYALNGIFILLMAILCINVATLVFARTASRSWDITVRSALGASRARIIRQLFTEALVLALVGAVVGLVLAKAAFHWGLGLVGSNDALPYWINDHLSWQAVLYALVLTVFGAAIVGVLPALRVTRGNVSSALRNESSARSTLRFGGFWTTVIVVQVAITVVLIPLAGNGVFESNRFSQRAAGIHAEQYLAAQAAIDQSESDLTDSTTLAARTRLDLGALERRLLAEPGVQGVAFASRLPVMDQFKYNIRVDTTLLSPTVGIRTSTLVLTSPGFFHTFGTSVVAGRDFAAGDFDASGVHAMVVNQSFAKYVLGGRNPIGQRIQIVSGEDDRVAGDTWYQIVGMVRDFGWQLPLPQEQAAMYLPRQPWAISNASMAVRVRDPSAFANTLRRVAFDVDPAIRVTNVEGLASVGGGEARANWTLTAVAWLISFVVLLLSATGIYALMAFTVTRRTREICIRAALGASKTRIVGGIFSRAFIQVGAGVAVGTGLSALRGGISARGVGLIIGADVVMLVAGFIACAIPLRRALRIEPTEALRAEG